MSKSIMQRKDGRCYLCEKLYGNDGYQQVEEHHALFGTADRKLSEHWGLKVYLCLGHHRCSSEAVHQNADMAMLIKKDAQKAFEEKHPEISFREVFGKNYLEEETKTEEEFSFQFLEGAENECCCFSW